jgi:hypothetical protein
VSAPRLRTELELDRLIFLARMGGSTRQRAAASGTIEVTEEAITTTSDGNAEAAGRYGWPLFGRAGSWASRTPAGGTIIVDALADDLRAR